MHSRTPTKKEDVYHWSTIIMQDNPHHGSNCWVIKMGTPSKEKWRKGESRGRVGFPIHINLYAWWATLKIEELLNLESKWPFLKIKLGKYTIGVAGVRTAGIKYTDGLDSKGKIVTSWRNLAASFYWQAPL